MNALLQLLRSNRTAFRFAVGFSVVVDVAVVAFIGTWFYHTFF